MMEVFLRQCPKAHHSSLELETTKTDLTDPDGTDMAPGDQRNMESAVSSAVNGGHYGTLEVWFQMLPGNSVSRYVGRCFILVFIGVELMISDYVALPPHATCLDTECFSMRQHFSWWFAYGFINLWWFTYVILCLVFVFPCSAIADISLPLCSWPMWLR